MSTDEFEDVIDPENEAALDEALKVPAEDGVMILPLINGKRIKIRYRPKSIGHMMEAANGTPTKRRSQDFRYKDWTKEVLKKLNTAILNTQIVDDIGGDRPGPGEIPISLIPPGAYYELYENCFPGYADDPKDRRNEVDAGRGKVSKGLRSRPPDPDSE